VNEETLNNWGGGAVASKKKEIKQNPMKKPVFNCKLNEARKWIFGKETGILIYATCCHVCVTTIFTS
jgi:hypothetical protein